MKKLFFLFLFKAFIYAQCSPIEVALHMNNADGWMFPYSAFYNGISSAYSEINLTNPECYQLLENNHECISDCLYLEENEVDQYLGRVGCLYYTCPDGDLLVHNTGPTGPRGAQGAQGSSGSAGASLMSG
mgnify:CR=1 FL=1